MGWVRIDDDACFVCLPDIKVLFPAFAKKKRTMPRVKGLESHDKHKNANATSNFLYHVILCNADRYWQKSLPRHVHVTQTERGSCCLNRGCKIQFMLPFFLSRLFLYFLCVSLPSFFLFGPFLGFPINRD
jgi:hypothetical protein